MAVIDTLEIKISADSSKAIAELNKLSTSLSNLDKNSKFTTLLNNLNKIDKTIKDTAANSDNIDKITKSMSKLDKSGKSIDNIANKLQKLGKSILSIAVISKIGTLISGAISEMNNYIEANNLFSVSMGSFYEEAYDWANKVNDKLGIDPAEFMKAEGIFMAMARGLGITNEQAYRLSKGMTELSYDLSSFMNIPIEEALTKMKSALAGEIEPLRAVGISVTQATLQEKALALGITENVNAMTDAEKSILRYKVILDSMKNMGAVGDLAKTIESPANALRILQMQLTQLARAIGSLFIPILTQVLPYIQAFTNVLTKLISKLAVLLGFKMPTWKNSDWNKISDTSGIVADNLDNAKNSAKKMKDYLMGFDELNVIKPDTGTSGGNDNLVSSGLGDLMLEDVWTDAMLDSIDSKVKSIEEKFQGIVDKSYEWKDTIMVIGSILAGGAIVGVILSISKTIGHIGSLSNLLFTFQYYGYVIGTTLVSAFSTLSVSILPIIAAVAAVAAVVYTLWKNWDKVVSIVQTFVEKTGLKNTFEEIKLSLATLFEKLGGLHDLFVAIGTVILGVLQPAIAVLMGLFNGFMNVIKPIITMIGGVIDILSALGNLIVGVFTGNLDKINDSINLFITGISEIMSGWFDGLIGFIGGFFTGVVEWLNSSLSFVINWIKNLKDWIISGFKNILNAGINLINKFFNWLNDKLNISWDGLSILGKEIFPGGSIQLFTIPLIPNVYKEGGFIEDGLFTMNQGEIAGKFNNGKSVVANNEQIISGISQGVYDAFMKALSENDSDKSINVNVYLDSDQITSSVEKNRNSKGLSLFGNELDYNY